jgi:hypothetical protein
VDSHTIKASPSGIFSIDNHIDIKRSLKRVKFAC